ncbi:bifunctional anthranilate synthase component I family protein/class IV aminotransferase [Massilia sp. BJB1822]|uniref:bifunctional anthranilate synthase component I family protein/class IV aminotransferase n=1 Tax=Massilia sp. BJB1822 TaxID=2744470 RepID=UPI001593316F|nr:bifunctional anthranilate synthase component I family protein/class IV aminotransferase [Massilia sp. BJB1822]NVD96774.1 bifunctional anthranilate synthase component I family protein/class IV aminotransferase [Massilia sp. BJB1822]
MNDTSFTGFPCFALLDDASPGDALAPRSRLYTGHAATLSCSDSAHWPQLLDQMQAALARGQYAVSLCSYELGGHLHSLPPRAAQDGQPPLAQILLFERCELLGQAEVAAWLAERSREEAGDAAAAAGLAAIRANVTEAEFSDAIERIRAYIAAGDTYQVNYTYRLRFDAFGSLYALYERLRARQPVPYGALIGLEDGTAVVSLSPELFVQHQDGVLTARPMKGTAPAVLPSPAMQDAAALAEENQRRAQALASDPKNRAENLMIVDLLRNDIGRVAVTGSVQVPDLFEVRRYSSVLQMTSTVRAELRPDASLTEVFDALYPCGSITGAPKRRTMEIIAELETAPRGIYTGAIGWFDPPAQAQGARRFGNFCLSVPIRTLHLQAPENGVRRGEMGVGAGIVYDSNPQDEFAECQLKARFLTGLSNDFELFETMHATRESGARHLERHLQRLEASARYFGFAWDEAAARAYIQMACNALPPAAPHRLRLAMNQAGAFAVQSGALTPLAEPVRVLLAPDATSASELFLRHKSTLRARYDAAWKAAEAQGAFDQLFFNERGELTEGGRSSVFLRLNGRWVTPPLACGLLPGVMRAVILDAWQAEEAVVTRAMLAQAEEIVVCNALRGALRATL